MNRARVRPVWLLSLLVAAPAAAQEDTLAKVFASYDKNSDKIVVRTEFPGSEEQWKAVDRNADGRLTLEEWRGSALARRLVSLRERDGSEPRARTQPADGFATRFEAARRMDQDADGRIARAEWTGTEDAFASLDLDKNGIVDGKDRALATRESVTDDEDPLRSERDYLQDAEYWLGRLDKDKDARISAAEAKGQRLERLFPAADRNKDGALDTYELQALAGRVAAMVYERNAGNARPRAATIPFAAWDKNNDGRLDSNEWVEMKYLFARVDRDRDAHVTRAELERYIRSIEGSDFLSRFDLDEDGRVTPDEFGGPIDAFRRADTNGDGVVSRSDR